MSLDDDSTPQVRPALAVLREYGGPVPGESFDSRVRRLEAFSAETGSAVNELAQAIDPNRIHVLERWANRIEGMRKRATRLLLASASAAALSLAGVGGWLMNRGEAHGIESQRILNLEDAIRRQEMDLRELRAKLSDMQVSPLNSGHDIFRPKVRMLSFVTTPKETLCARF